METKPGYIVKPEFIVAKPEKPGEMTDSQLIAVLRDALQQPPVNDRPAGFMRSEEIAEQLGIGMDRLRRELRKQIKAGTVEVKKITWTDIAGDPCRVPAYRLKNGNL